ncbi:hypothetical protein DPX39_040008700 [Trypanosoma brucei equiperdum]|uniref:Rhodanese domain-containing protein n=1 Tax=Trypanosoma brucei equiperdum TaxID=630700 RepID=A0A3L6LCL1_9TRYP|nr:hypothetical protein DPX39_040008700 [Trypanosoma brucei equiperdum]
MQFIYSLFTPSERLLSREMVRNEIARTKLSAARLQHEAEKEFMEKEMQKIDNEMRAKEESYAAQAKPLLDDFNDISLAQHYYQEVGTTLASQVHLVSQRVERELEEFGYTSKKLISVGLNYEALKRKMKAGLPFNEELSAVLKDAESEDVNLVAAPLKYINSIPSPAVVRVTAFNLGRAIVEAGKAPAAEPVRGILDFFKFRTSLSPTMLVSRQLRALKSEAEFLRFVERGEYHRALSLAEDVYAGLKREGVKDAAVLDEAFGAFRRTVLPTVAGDMLLRYCAASLCAARFACVENMLKE